MKSGQAESGSDLTAASGWLSTGANGSSRNARFHFLLTFTGINLTFTPMHFLGFNLQPRRIPDFPDNFNSWNFLSSIGSSLTLLSTLLLSTREEPEAFFHLPST